MQELRKNSGSQFDPVVVDVFVKLVEESVISTQSFVAKLSGPSSPVDAVVRV